MPLIKRFQGRIVVRTRRVGEIIRIRLAGHRPDQPRRWIGVPIADYLAGRTCQFVTKPGPYDLRATTLDVPERPLSNKSMEEWATDRAYRTN